jgi:predicted TIM-barrel fold metal-dependent hydrolase
VIVDTHVHVVADDHDRYPLRPPLLPQFGAWFRDAPVTVEELLAQMDTAGVDRAVVVQAYSAYGSDNSYAVDAARAHSERCTAVCIVDPSEAGLRALRELAAEPVVTGVRLFAIGNPLLAELDDAAVEPVWQAAAELDLRTIVTILAPQLAGLRAVLEREPHRSVTLDHCGFPDLSGGRPYARAASLFDLAAFPNLHLKVSSHLLEQAEAVGDPRDLVDALATSFGIDRLMWGSDFPQTHDRPYAELVELGRFACSGLPDDEQRAFLGGNALRLWPGLAPG